MNCTDIAAIIDEHRDARLAPAERGAVDAHLLGCADCSAAWHAHAELLALTVPAAAPALLDRVLVAVAAGPRPAHGMRRTALIAVALVAGAALAAITVTRLPERVTQRPTPPSIGAPPAPTRPSPVPVATDAAAPTPRVGADQPIDTNLIAFDVVAVVTTPPVYPAEAVKRGLEGSVTVQFHVTPAGIAENVSVAHSTDPVFDAAAVDAVRQWRYLPRVLAGKRVARDKVQTVLRFQLDKGGAAPPPTPQPVPPADAYAQADLATFTAGLERALDRIAVDNFRGAELELDELRARYELGAPQEGKVWDFYAYIYLIQGNYDRSIEALETAVAAYARGPWPSQSSSLALAQLCYARHQYSEALRTLLELKRSIAGKPLLAAQPNPIVDGFIERLRALGVTEESLLPAR
jgi:TonB family protein